MRDVDVELVGIPAAVFCYASRIKVPLKCGINMKMIRFRV